MHTPSRRNKLNPNQIHIIKLLFKFRFSTPQLLAEYKKVRVSAVGKTLIRLLDMEYVDRHYPKSYIINRRGSEYYLTAKGIAYLKDTGEFNENVLHAMYKNKSAGQTFVDHNLTVFSVYLALREIYPEVFHVFTKTGLYKYGYFPEPRPDVYLNRIHANEDAPNEYLLDVFPDTQFFILKKRFDVLLEHFDSGEWEAESETEYPTILLVCADVRHERKLKEYVAKTLDNMGIDELRVYTTTLRALKASSEPRIWTDVLAPEVLLSL